MPINVYRTEEETAALLESQIDDPRGLSESIAVRAVYWRHSCVLAPGQRQEVEVGSYVDLVCRIGLPHRRWRLVRRPSGSRAELNEYRLRADAPGVYQVELHLAGFVRTVEIVAVPSALLERIGPRGGINDRVLTLRSRLNDPNVTTEWLCQALESNNPAEWSSLSAPTN